MIRVKHCYDLLGGSCKLGNSCRFVHEVPADPPRVENNILCSECGQSHKDKLIENCLHIGESNEGRRGGWSYETSKWFCCECTDKQNCFCVRHTSKSCKCFPKCIECGSAKHTLPMKSWFIYLINT